MLSLVGLDLAVTIAVMAFITLLIVVYKNRLDVVGYGLLIIGFVMFQLLIDELDGMGLIVAVWIKTAMLLITIGGIFVLAWCSR